MTWMPPTRSAFDKIVFYEDAIALSIARAGLCSILLGQASDPEATTQNVSLKNRDPQILEYRIPAKISTRRGGAMKLVIGNEPVAPTGPDPIRADSDKSAIAHFHFTVKLDKPFSLAWILWAETSAAQHDNHGVPFLKFGQFPPCRCMVG
jgi:hypothetical protein